MARSDEGGFAAIATDVASRPIIECRYRSGVKDRRVARRVCPNWWRLRCTCCSARNESGAESPPCQPSAVAVRSWTLPTATPCTTPWKVASARLPVVSAARDKNQVQTGELLMRDCHVPGPNRSWQSNRTNSDDVPQQSPLVLSRTHLRG
jgi:hypothetical protein